MKRIALTLLATIAIATTSWHLLKTDERQPAVPTFVLDSFTDTAGTSLTSHTGETGAAWTRVFGTGEPVISNDNRVRGSNTELAHCIASGSPQTPDYTVSVTLRRVGVASGSNSAGITARASSSLNEYYYSFYSTSSQTVRIGRRDSTGVTDLAQADFGVLDLNRDYVFSLSVVGDQISLSVDGVEVLAATDDVISSAGKAGVYYRSSTTSDSSGIHLDNFSATDAVDIGGNDFAVDSPEIFFSPYSWRVSGSGYAISNTPGAYIKTRFTGASIALLVDTSINSGQEAIDYPAIAWSVNGGEWQRDQLSAEQTVKSLADGLSEGSHSLELYFAGVASLDDRWSAPEAALKVTGFRLADGESLVEPEILEGRAIVFADSNGEGREVLAVDSTVAHQDAAQAFPLIIGRALGCEVGVIGFASQGYTKAGRGGVPKVGSAWNLYSAGQSRLTGGLLSPSPDWVISHHGQNDFAADASTVQSDVASLITAWSAAAPEANIAFASPSNLEHVDAIEAAVTAAADDRIKFVTTGKDFLAAGTSGANQYSNGNHLNSRGHALYAGIVAAELQEAFGAAGGGTGEYPTASQIAAAVLAAAAVSPIHADVRAVDEAAGVASEESVLAVLGAVSDVSFGAVVVPLLGQIQSRTEGTTIRVFTRETTTLTLAVVNAIGQPVDLSGATLSLIIERAKGGDISVIEDGDIAVNESTISFAIPAEVSAAEGYHNWALRSSDGAVLMQGPLIVEYAPEVDQ